jgi:hypothetical protein
LSSRLVGGKAEVPVLVGGRPGIADFRSLSCGGGTAENSGMAELSDAIDLLLDDHRYMEVLMDRLDQESDPEEMRTLFLRIAGELAAHEVELRAHFAEEEEILVPAMRAAIEPAALEELGLRVRAAKRTARIFPGG